MLFSPNLPECSLPYLVSTLHHPLPDRPVGAPQHKCQACVPTETLWSLGSRTLQEASPQVTSADVVTGAPQWLQQWELDSGAGLKAGPTGQVI